ncbi:MAG TPA: MlaD family protein [Baekduia sp.]|nr:MlaD family protein [Baekduia sp.]
MPGRPPRRKPLERAAHAAERLEGHTLALGLLVLAVAVALSWVSIAAINGVPLTNPYRVQVEVPADGPLLKDGDEVRIAGQRAGQVRGVRIGRAGGALLDVDLDDGPIGPDATAAVRLRGLAGATYLDIAPGTRSDALPEGGLVPRDRTRAGVELTDVVDAFDPSTSAAIRRALGGYGPGFAGRGGDLGRAVSDLGPALATATPLLRAATERRGELARLLGGVRRVARGFAAPGTTELRDLLGPAARTLAVTAARRDDLRAAVDGVAPLARTAAATLPQADALLADLAPAARRLAPAVAALDRRLPAVRRLLARRATLPSLSELAERARPTLRAAPGALADLAAPAAALAPLAGPAGVLSGHLARYERDLFLAPHGFTQWGGFRYGVGEAKGARAVRFLPVFTCMRARRPYPEPGQALRDAEGCTP